MTDVDEVKKALTKKKRKPASQAGDYLSTGSTLLNLAITGHPNRGFKKGHYYFLVGDSMSGKSFLSRTCLAEASINPAFDDYRFIDDDVERGALMNFERYFGERAAQRREPPQAGGCSDTVEDFYYNIDDALSVGPCIYVLDSMDALSSKYEGQKFDERKKAARKGTTAKGDYGDGKAKVNSSGIRTLMGRLDKTGSILIVINQTRDNIGAGLFEPKQTRSGGRALTFYAAVELWSSVGQKIKRKVREKDRVVGVNVRIQVKKNRITGRNRMVEIPIYYDTGLDDTGSMVNYLIAEGHWKGTENKVEAPEYEFRGTKEKLIRKVEEESLEDDLKQLTTEVWKEIEAACTVTRKNRYAQ